MGRNQTNAYIVYTREYHLRPLEQKECWRRGSDMDFTSTVQIVSVCVRSCFYDGVHMYIDSVSVSISVWAYHLNTSGVLPVIGLFFG